MAQYSTAFGTRVAETLRAKGLSPYDVERRSEGRISHQTVRNMASGKVPYLDYVWAFAEVVGLDTQETNDLLEHTGNPLRVPVRVRRGVSQGNAPHELALAS